jgi:hypothetical protein
LLQLFFCFLSFYVISSLSLSSKKKLRDEQIQSYNTLEGLRKSTRENTEKVQRLSAELEQAKQAHQRELVRANEEAKRAEMLERKSTRLGEELERVNGRLRRIAGGQPIAIDEELTDKQQKLVEKAKVRRRRRRRRR